MTESRLRRVLRSGLDALANAGDPDEAEAVHRARVASRRLRATIELMTCGGRRRRARRALRRLRRVTRALGPLREADVDAEVLRRLESEGADPAECAAIEHVICWLGRRRGPELRRARRALSRLDLKAVARDLEATPVAPEVAGHRLRPRLERARARIAELAAGDDPEAMHEVRIVMKTLRYTAEALGDDDIAAWAASYQDSLGRYHDAFVARLLLERRRERLAGRGLTNLVRGLTLALARLAAVQRAAWLEARTMAASDPKGGTG